MALPFSFTGNLDPTGEQLDANLAALGKLTPIICGVSGTNSITLTPVANTPSVAAYANYMQFTGVVAATNTGAVTVQVGSLAALNVYKDTVAGPVVLVGGEMVQNTALILMYDSTLNTGSGGFHLISPASMSVRNYNTMATLTFGSIVPNGASTATVTLGGTSVGDIVGIGFPSTPSVGIVFTGFVPNAGSVCISAFNAFWTLATVTPPAGGYRIDTRRYTS
jgi:hypothetical protein